MSIILDFLDNLNKKNSTPIILALSFVGAFILLICLGIGVVYIRKKRLNLIFTKRDLYNFRNGEEGTNYAFENKNYSMLPYEGEKELDAAEFSIGL